MTRKILMLFLAIVILAGSAWAQDLQATKAEYDAKVQKLNDVRAKMSAEGVTKDQYDTLKKEYDSLSKEIDALKAKLNADKEYLNRQNQAKQKVNDGNTFLRQQQWDKAIEAYNEALSIDEGNGSALYGKGYALYRSRQYDDAIAILQTAVEKNATDSKSWSLLAGVYKSKKNYSKSQEAYRKAIESNPQDYKSMYNLGVVFYLQKSYNSALQYYNQAAQVKADYDLAYVGIGDANTALGRSTDAITAYTMAVELNPKNDKANIKLAELYYNGNDFGASLEAAKACLSISRNGANKAAANYWAGIAAKKLGRKQDALTYLNAALNNRTWRDSAQYEIDNIDK